MPPTKPTKTTNSAIAKLALTINDLSAALNLLIKRPLKDVQGVVRHEREQLGRQARRKKGFSLLRLPMVIAVSLLSVLAKILLAPLELWAAVFQKKKFPRSLLLVMIPCCCFLIGWAGYSWLGFQQGREIGSLRSLATTAVEQTNFTDAVGYFDQLEAADATLSQEEKFSWALALSQTDQSDRANELLHELAPSKGKNPGYAPAHQFAAISLVRTQKLPYSTEVKQLLSWHLEAGGPSEQPDVNFAKAQYLISVEQYQPAIEAMTIAASAKPELNLVLARLYNKVGDNKNEQSALAIAQTEFEGQLESDSANHQARIALAQIYLRQRAPERAEEQLRAGAELAPEVFRPQLSIFFMEKFRSLPSGASLEMKIDSLMNAWRYDWQNVATCQAAIRLYRELEDQGRELVFTAIQEAADEEPLAAMPHFALGIIHRVENRLPESKGAVEAAHQRLNPGQPGFSVVANNLAWLLAHDKQPDLEQAFKLADMAVSRNPHEGGLRDTLATVLMKQGHYQRALVEFQKALPTIRDKSPVHLKMAEIYDQLEQPQLAALHRTRSQPD